MPVLKNDKNFSKSNNNIVKIEESVIEKASLSEIKTIKDKQVIQRIKKVIIYKPQLIAPPIPPKHPMITRSKNQQGTVWLGVPLDHQGRQQTLYRHKSSGIPVLDKAAIKAVKQWQFAQFQHNYHAEQVKIRIPIEFSLN